MKNVELWHGDSLELMKNIPDESVNLIITDPPYGINFQSNGAKIKRYDVLNGDEKKFDIAPYWKEFERVICKNGAIYVYCRWDVAYEWQAVIKPNSQIIIPRGRVGMGNLNIFSTDYEVVLFKAYGNHKINATTLKIKNNSHAKNPPEFKVRIGSLWNDAVSNEAWERSCHPTQKTVSSVEKMIQVSSNIGDTILDPFAGSGTTLMACKNTNRRGIGIEVDEKYFTIAEKRIAK